MTAVPDRFAHGVGSYEPCIRAACRLYRRSLRERITAMPGRFAHEVGAERTAPFARSAGFYALRPNALTPYALHLTTNH